MQHKIKPIFGVILTSLALCISGLNPAIAATPANTDSGLEAEIIAAAGPSDSEAAFSLTDSLMMPNTAGVTAIQHGGLTYWRNVKPGLTYVARAMIGGAQQLISIESATAPTTYEFSLKPGITGKAGPSGQVFLSDSRQRRVAVVSPPWAKDANGTAVATSYTVADGGKKIVQSVQHKGAAYPVVADPRYSWWWGGVDVYLSRSETQWALTAGLGAITALFPAGYIAAVGLSVIQQMMQNAWRQNKCLVAHYSWVRPSWTGLYNC